MIDRVFAKAMRPKAMITCLLFSLREESNLRSTPIPYFQGMTPYPLGNRACLSRLGYYAGAHRFKVHSESISCNSFPQNGQKSILIPKYIGIDE